MAREAAQRKLGTLGARYDAAATRNADGHVYRLPRTGQWAMMVGVAFGSVNLTFHAQCPCRKRS